MSQNPPIWTTRPFVGLLADSFVDGTELEGGYIATSVQVINLLLARLTGTAEGKAKLTLLTAAHEFNALGKLSSMLKATGDMSVNALKNVKDKASFAAFLAEWQKTIEDLAPGNMMFVPGGWTGLTGSGALLHILEHNPDNTYSFVTCNSGAGLAYHPAKPVLERTHVKMKHKTCIRINDIPKSRMLDPAFWYKASVIFFCFVCFHLISPINQQNKNPINWTNRTHHCIHYASFVYVGE